MRAIPTRGALDEFKRRSWNSRVRLNKPAWSMKRHCCLFKTISAYLLFLLVLCRQCNCLWSWLGDRSKNFGRLVVFLFLIFNAHYLFTCFAKIKFWIQMDRFLFKPTYSLCKNGFKVQHFHNMYQILRWPFLTLHVVCCYSFYILKLMLWTKYE